MAFKMKGSSYKMGGAKTKDTMAYMKSPLEAASALKTTGVQEFPEDLGLSPGERGKAIKRHDKAYKRGHAEHTGQPQDEKSPNEMKSPLEAMGGKFKFDGVDEEGFDLTKQISDQEYAELLAKKADIQTQEDAIIAERDADMSKSSESHYDRKLEELYRDNPNPTVFAKGLDETEYKSIAELEEVLSTMDPASQEYRDLKEIHDFETTTAGEEMTERQRKLSMDKS